jgi:biopolymer transport protein ExbD
MAASTHDEDGPIVGINVTPLVDVVLVLLVILMVTAGYIASKSIPVDLPKGQTAESTTTTLTLSVDKQGNAYLEAERIAPAALRRAIRRARETDPAVRAVIAADGSAEHRHVVSVIDLLRQEGVNRFAINVEPETVAEP